MRFLLVWPLYASVSLSFWWSPWDPLSPRSCPLNEIHLLAEKHPDAHSASSPHILSQTVSVNHGQIKILLVISLFLDCSSVSNQSHPQKLCIWIGARLCVIGFQASYGEENKRSGKLKNTWLLNTGAAHGCFLSSLLYFLHTTGYESQDECECCLRSQATPQSLGWLQMMNHFT